VEIIAKTRKIAISAE